MLASVVLLALVSTLYWSEHHKPTNESTKASDASPAILKLDESTITKVELKKKDAEPIVLAKSTSGSWQITEPKPFNADQSNVSSTLSSLATLNSERVIDDKPSDLKQYGLDPPVVEVDITTKDNQSQKAIPGRRLSYRKLRLCHARWRSVVSSPSPAISRMRLPRISMISGTSACSRSTPIRSAASN